MSAAAERELLGPETEILAPELEALINSATDKLDAAAVEAKLSDDPLQVHLIALKYVLKALRRLFVDGALKLAREIRNAQQPVQNKELMQAFKQGVVAVAGDFIGQMRLRFYLTGAGLLVGMFLIGLAIGWYEMTSRVEALNQTMNAVTASAWLTILRANNLSDAYARCLPLPQPNGGKACSFALWLEQPPVRR